MGLKPKIVILIILIPHALLLLLGCGDSSHEMPDEVPETSLLREIDIEAGIVCYRWWGNASNIDCLPLADTTLEITADPSPALSD